MALGVVSLSDDMVLNHLAKARYLYGRGSRFEVRAFFAGCSELDPRQLP
jgi:hypothetical protein